nr:Hpt domain-containing protein [uncultured Roseateles sp.]
MTLPTIDTHSFEALQANAGADFVVTLVEAFAEEAPRLMAEVRQAASTADVERFQTLAHALKSNGVAFGATRLAEAARRLEWQGPSAGAAAIDELAVELDAAMAALRTLARVA